MSAPIAAVSAPERRCGRVQLHGEQHAGERRTVRPAGEARQAQADQEAERERDQRRERRLHALREQQRPAGEAAAVQHRELERLSRERECCDAREHRQRHRTDLEHDEQDRHAQVLHPLIHDPQERVESGEDPGAREPGLVVELVLDLAELRRDRLDLVERHALEVEVDVPCVLRGQPQRVGELQGGVARHQFRLDLRGIGRRERAAGTEPERVRGVGRQERSAHGERGLLPARSDQRHLVADPQAPRSGMRSRRARSHPDPEARP